MEEHYNEMHKNFPAMDKAKVHEYHQHTWRVLFNHGLDVPDGRCFNYSLLYLVATSLRPLISKPAS